jgi:hypothetical protein
MSKQDVILKHKLSFGYITLLSKNIAEVIVNHNTKMTIEIVEEYDNFLANYFHEDFGLLINRINDYSFTYEASLSIASSAHLKAIAVVSYAPQSREQSLGILAKRKIDGWNMKVFSGLELGWQQGLNWLESELSKK